MRTTPNKSNQITNTLSSEKGMTLIDVAIALLVIGLLVTPAFYALKEYKQTRARTVTENNIRDVDTAIRNYFVANEFYPCPANPALPRNDSNHGTAATTPGGACTITNAAGLAQGSIPHSELGLDIEKVYDGWGNKILYAVDNSRASSAAAALAAAPAAPAFGPVRAITISEIPLVPNPQHVLPDRCAPVNYVCANAVAAYAPGPYAPCGTNNPPSPQTAGNVQYTILSHGEDGTGAFSDRGTAIGGACNIANAADQENCDGDAIFQTRQCVNANINNATFYDDFTLLGAITKVSDPSSMLSQSNDNADGIAVGMEYVGIRNSDPRRELDVIGNIKITDDNATTGDGKDGAARSDDYCDPTGTNCFDSTLIGGTVLATPCPAGQTMVGIRNNGPLCETVLTSTLPPTDCSATNGIQSISGGTVTCVP